MKKIKKGSMLILDLGKKYVTVVVEEISDTGDSYYAIDADGKEYEVFSNNIHHVMCY